MTLPKTSAAVFKSGPRPCSITLNQMETRYHRCDGNAMNSLQWSLCPTIASVPGKLSGAWVFRDSRAPVSVVFDNLEAGASIDEVTEWFHLSREQVQAVIEFAARHPEAPQMPASSKRIVAHSF